MDQNESERDPKRLLRQTLANFKRNLILLDQPPSQTSGIVSIHSRGPKLYRQATEGDESANRATEIS